jgi:hypothetical protein
LPGRLDGAGDVPVVSRQAKLAQLIIAGHHRGTHGRRFARMVLARRHLTRFRVQGVYSPALIRALTRPLPELGRDHAPRLWQTRHEAEQAAAIWRALPLTARADDGSFTTMVTDPPPTEITLQDQRYYLAHFSARWVIYSRSLPQSAPASAAAPRHRGRRSPSRTGRSRRPASVTCHPGRHRGA